MDVSAIVVVYSCLYKVIPCCFFFFKVFNILVAHYHAQRMKQLSN